MLVSALVGSWRAPKTTLHLQPDGMERVTVAAPRSKQGTPHENHVTDAYRRCGGLEPSESFGEGASRGVVGFGVEPRWLVAGCELGCGEVIALGVEQAHGVL